MIDINNINKKIIKKYIESKIPFKHINLDCYFSEGILSKKVVFLTVMLYLQNKNLYDTAKQLNINPYLLRKFFLTADKLNIIDYRKIKHLSKRPYNEAVNLFLVSHMSENDSLNSLLSKYILKEDEIDKWINSGDGKKPLSEKRKKVLIKYKKVYDKLSTLEKAASRLSLTSKKLESLLIEGERHGLYKYTKNAVKHEKEISRLKEIKKVHEKCLTLQKTGDELGITRERVRQLLKKGEQLGLYAYLNPRERKEKRLRELTKKYNKNILLNVIKDTYGSNKICKKLDLKKHELKYLLNYYDVDCSEYYKLMSMKKYMREYSQIVENLGHHPSTTEMNRRKDWRSVWAGIDRYWGDMETFRRDYGIGKPKHKINLRTKIAFKNYLQKKELVAKKNKENILNFIEKNNLVSLKVIYENMEFALSTTSKYVLELIREGKVIKVGRGNKIKYRLKN